ncbi:MAG: disulfide bond formation protein B [DPANN group archaeon]|nr:disulfide bond formation protein B [DPANN group archaeon]
MNTDPVFDILAYLVLGSLVFLSVFLVILALKVLFWKKGFPPFLARLFAWFPKNGLLFAFIISLFSVTGSLFMSNIALLEPCHLCWWQRIFMFPLPFILGMMLWKRLDKAVIAVLPLPIIGGFISLYQWYSQITDSSTACAVSFNALGASTSCNSAYLMYFGFMSIPFMTFVAFGLIAAFLAVHLEQ